MPQTVMKPSNKRIRDLAFVTSELFIVLALFTFGLVGAVVLARKLHLGWLASAGVILATVVVIYLGLSFLGASARRRRP
jgi:hypothetical protein